MKTPQRLLLALLAALAALSMSACGKKGPPRLPVVVRPAPPEALQAVRRGDEALLRWRQPGAKDIAEFIVERKSDGEFEEAAAVAGSPFKDAGLDPGSTYVYKVAARDGRGIIGPYSAPVEVGPDRGLHAPRGLSFSINPYSVALSWEYEAAASFNVYRRVEGGEYPARPINPAALGKSPLEDRLFVANTVSYVVRAVDATPGASVAYEGPPSEELTIRPEDYVPSAPTGVSGVRVGDSIVLLWQENPEGWVRGYSVYRAGAGGVEEKAGETTTPTFTVRAAPKGLATYRVRAAGPAAEGPPSVDVAVPPSKE